ncbi:uncharacterized membrane protein YcaP (DUF421 family) [Scopulibacillus darangshiensis]|uniref:Uncharacterized membrane protein YcaP (DUF421 family) n=1 Tax=Scopulibacillus darangshiensis TaxID=442528 RepID=A0A4V2SNN3_9BACL|nr:DUF421 domain-containing protein [Scopulibacillus darangshiensis]TCP31776.1 uncharacterized membrane protein YcaP (DUF421 family) [Scopulibacillus darangshiensis]
MPEWLDIVVRSLLFLIVLFLVTKWLGKKQISQLSFFEYVTGITIGSIAGEVAMGLENNIFYGIIGIVIFSAVPLLINIVSLKNKKIRDFVEGNGTIFIKNGKVMEDNLKKEKYSTDELLELLRKRNVFQVADVEFALLEPTGDLSVLLKKEKQPLTASDLGLPVAPIKEPQTVIMDGEILDEPLSTIGLNRNWLKGELSKLGVAIENVFLGQVDGNGQLTVDLFDDKIEVAAPQEKPLLLANIKKCQADLELFALSTTSAAAKEMYGRNARKMDELLQIVSPYLKD